MTACRLLLLVLFFGADAAGAALPQRAWLRVHAEFDQVGHGLVYFDDVAFVATDGGIHATLATFRSANQLAFYWNSEQRAGTASAAAVSELRRVLSENSVGLLAGDCSVPRRVVGPGSVRLTWYGRGARRHDVAVRISDPSLPPCDDEVARVLDALAVFLFDAGVQVRGIGGHLP